jgi:hypothetical protein
MQMLLLLLYTLQVRARGGGTRPGGRARGGGVGSSPVQRGEAAVDTD